MGLMRAMCKCNYKTFLQAVLCPSKAVKGPTSQSPTKVWVERLFPHSPGHFPNQSNNNIVKHASCLVELVPYK
eukprot:6471553-Amphidinium_carterae.1